MCAIAQQKPNMRRKKG